MNTRDQAIAIMRELDLAPDCAETAKQQQAIERGLERIDQARYLLNPGQTPEDAVRHFATMANRLTDELREARDRFDLVEADFGDLYRDYRQLMEDAGTLIASLDGSDGMPKAWWIKATEALQRIDARLHPQEVGATKSLPEDAEKELD